MPAMTLAVAAEISKSLCSYETNDDAKYNQKKTKQTIFTLGACQHEKQQKNYTSSKHSIETVSSATIASKYEYILAMKQFGRFHHYLIAQDYMNVEYFIFLLNFNIQKI